MFNKSLFITLTAFALSTVSVHAAPAPCADASTVTVVATAAPASGSSAAKSNNNAAGGSASGAATAASFGSCSVPQIKFAAGLDGRKETAFAPVDTKSFNHGSADNIDVISSFICGQLSSKCRANAAAQTTCKTASAAADKAAKGTGAQADAFNAAFGKTTTFASVTEIGTNGKAVPGTGSSSNKGGSQASSVAAVAVSSNIAIATSAAAAPPATSSTAVINNGAGSSSTNATANNPDLQSSLTLDPSVIATGFEQDGQAVPTAGQVPSLTSDNNFINFCATVNLPITNGEQLTGGSCNPAPMGVIPSTNNMPSSKFIFPKNLQTITANTPFTIQMAILHIETGNFVNAQSNYYAAPQHLNSDGDIIGHTHVVVEQLEALDQTTPTNPAKFAFFKGVNGEAVNGVLSADVTAGLPDGFYRLASINAAMNHQPVLVAIAQHGSLDDMVYFTVSGSNSTASAATAATAATAVSSAVAVVSAPAASSSAKAVRPVAPIATAPASNARPAKKGAN